MASPPRGRDLAALIAPGLADRPRRPRHDERCARFDGYSGKGGIMLALEMKNPCHSGCNGNLIDQCVYRLTAAESVCGNIELPLGDPDPTANIVRGPKVNCCRLRVHNPRAGRNDDLQDPCPLAS